MTDFLEIVLVVVIVGAALVFGAWAGRKLTSRGETGGCGPACSCGFEGEKPDACACSDSKDEGCCSDSKSSCGCSSDGKGQKAG
jgi:hypothetical protein